MKLIEQIKKEKNIFFSGFTLVGACIGLAMALITVIACGNFYVYTFLLKPRHSPPAFLFYLFFAFLSALVGGLSGMVAVPRCRKSRLNGILFTALSFLFILLWYIAFFKTLSFVFGLFLIISAVLLMLFAIKESFEKGILPFLFAVLAALGQVWLLWLNVTVILLN